jgi:glycyl-tRNA synthetase beta chain
LSTLLFEIGCEELPASACAEALSQLRDRLPTFGGGQVYATPRRLVLIADELPDREPDQWVKGPPEHLRETAAEGFARKQGVSVDELEVRDGFLGVVRPGRPMGEALPERLDELVRSLAFSKSMVWDERGLRFARPVRWLCAKLDEQTLDGFCRSSFGHRFTHGAVEIPHSRDYLERLREAGVEVDQDKRLDAITRGLRDLGLEQPNERVLAEVVYLVESPVVLSGQFDERFLQLPQRVVVTAMEAHQRYFPLGGNRFAFVANGGDRDTVTAGNENVLEGRLEDAAFTFERDVARGIDELVKDLQEITFVAGAGSFAQKAERLGALVEALGGGEASQEAARLAKADQAGELVREFPDLEGHIGAEYARMAGYPEAVCAAIDEQYLPESAGGPLPETETGRVLSAADKIDNLTVAFALGQKPTGSRDPYGLRRAAIGLCRLALEANLELHVGRLVERDHALLVQQGADVKEDPYWGVVEFVEERLEGLLDVPVEFVRAARAAGLHELGAVARLAQWLAGLEDGRLEQLHTAYTRAARIAAGAELDTPAVESVLIEPAEIELHEAVGRSHPEIMRGVDNRDFDAALTAAAPIFPAVDRFFDEVLVMAEDEAIRENRLKLLLDVVMTLGLLGDISQIPR